MQKCHLYWCKANRNNNHLQFASPEIQNILDFVQAVNAIIDYCNYMDIPVVGGKVSFYNETKGQSNLLRL